MFLPDVTATLPVTQKGGFTYCPFAFGETEAPKAKTLVTVPSWVPAQTDVTVQPFAAFRPVSRGGCYLAQTF